MDYSCYSLECFIICNIWDKVYCANSNTWNTGLCVEVSEHINNSVGPTILCITVSSVAVSGQGWQIAAPASFGSCSARLFLQSFNFMQPHVMFFCISNFKFVQSNFHKIHLCFICCLD